MTGEAAIHEQLCAWLKRNGYVWRRDRMDKRTSAATGSEPDFWIAKGNRVCFCEIKVGRNKTSPAQDKRFAELAQAGCTVKIARTLEDAVGHIEAEFGPERATGHPEALERPSEPKWKSVGCPTCHAQAGSSCGDTARGAFHWERRAPHAARKRLAEGGDAKCTTDVGNMDGQLTGPRVLTAPIHSKAHLMVGSGAGQSNPESAPKLYQVSSQLGQVVVKYEGQREIYVRMATTYDRVTLPMGKR